MPAVAQLVVLGSVDVVGLTVAGGCDGAGWGVVAGRVVVAPATGWEVVAAAGFGALLRASPAGWATLLAPAPVGGGADAAAPPPDVDAAGGGSAFGVVVGGVANGWASDFGEGVPLAAATAESPSLLLALPLAAGPEDDVDACGAFRLSCMFA